MTERGDAPSAARRLVAVKVLHTVVWAFFASCVLALPIVAWQRRFTLALGLIGAVLGETAVLLANRWACPLTAVAARYTGDRRDNFDIYLPEWLARHNKTLFGGLFAAGIVLTLVRWLTAAG